MTSSGKLFRVLRQIVTLIANDAGLLSEIRGLADEFVTHTIESTTATSPVSKVAVEQNVGTEESSPSIPSATSDINVAHVAARCRLKAQGSLWAAERLRLKKAGADHQSEIAPRDRKIIEQAKSLSYLWMNSPSAPVPDDPCQYEVLAGCFDALASVLTVLTSSHEVVTSNRHLLVELLKLAAEAQSAVREAARRIGGASDPDQVDAYWWVRQSAASIGQYLSRHLRTDDPAEPTSWSDLQCRISRLGEQVAITRTRRRLLQKLRYQLEQTTIGDNSTTWDSVARTVDEAVQAGIQPSNVELRGLLIPHVEIIPPLDDAPQGFRLAIREALRFQESACSAPDDEDDSEFVPIIEAAAEMVQGRSLALIGGDARPVHQKALEKALRLSELVWVPTKHGQSVSTFEPFVARPDVVAVLLAIRWASHSYTDVRHQCRKYDKPLVRLPGGYSPNQVATQLLNQAGWRFKQSLKRSS